jgi:Trk K+ transport system NAD-binding subunit
LTARSLNPNLRIITQDNQEINREKLEKAGADKVISTNAISGLRTASEMIRPEVVKFLDQMMQAHEKAKTIHFTELPLAEIKTPEVVRLLYPHSQNQENAKIMVKDVGKYTGLLVVAIKFFDTQDEVEADLIQRQHRYRFTPRGDVELDRDDILVVIGTQDRLDAARGI